MNKRKRDYESDIDNGVVDQLASILAEYTGDANKLLLFYEKGHVQQCIQVWSYYAQSSNHGKLAGTAPKIAQLLKVSNSNSAFLKYGSDTIRYILDENMKVIYRSLFIARSNITNPTLDILREITCFNKGSLVPELFSAFDFTIKIIPKLLATEGGGLRKAFISFYLSFLRQGTYIIRKDLISQKRVISGWIKHLNEWDDEDTIVETLQVFTECILKEPAFLKATKIGFFNDWVMGRLIHLLNNRHPKVRTRSADFMRLICLNSDYGIVFPDNGWSKGEVNNRLLLNVAKMLKPWDSLEQQNMVVEILSTYTELVAPYVNDLISTTSFDPKLTSWWISTATLLTRICEISLDESRLLLFEPPTTDLVLNNTLPFKASSITRALQFSETPLIRYLGAQTLYFGIKRLRRIQKIYEKKNWDFQLVLLEAKAQRLPNPQTIVTLAATHDKEEPLLRTIILKLISEYVNLCPPEDSTRTVPISANWTNIHVEGLELVQVEASLDIQMKVSGLGKWWNKSGSADYSMFTGLLRFAGLNNSLSSKIVSLLYNLVKPTLLFQEDTCVHPVDILVSSVMQYGDNNKIWRLIEESVSRCMRSPYKYVDTFAAARKSEASTFSPFSVSLMEQMQYVEEPREEVEKWLIKFIRDCCICGEDWLSAHSMASEKGLKFSNLLTENSKDLWHTTFSEEECFDYLLSSSDSEILSRTDLQFKIGTSMDLESIKFRALRSSAQVAEHLFNSIPVGEEFVETTLSDPKYFKDFFSPLGTKYCNFYLRLVQPEWNNSRLKQYLVDNDLSVNALWLQDTETVLRIAVSRPAVSTDCINELTKRNTGLSFAAIKELIPKADERACQALARNIRQYFDEAIPENQLHDLFSDIIGNNRQIVILCAFIQKLGKFFRDLDVEKLDSNALVQLAIAISRYAPDYLDTVDKSKAFSTGLSISTLPLYTLDRIRSNTKVAEEVFSFVDSLSGAAVLSLEVVSTMSTLYKYDVTNSTVKRWFNQCFLWLTKQFAEEASDSISQAVRNLLSALEAEIKEIDIWQVSGKKILNFWIESSIRWLKVPEVLALVNRVVFSALPSSGLEHRKILQLIINGAFHEGRGLALLVWKLFKFDPPGQTDIQNDIMLKLFKASPDPGDWLLMDVLRQIESITTTSWATRVISWTIRQGDERLMVSSRDGLEVILDPSKIAESSKNIQCDEWFEPASKDTFDEITSKMNAHSVLYGRNETIRYNPAFLFFALASSDIFGEKNVNMKKLVDSGGLSFIISCLGSQRLGRSARMIVRRLSNSELFKYREKTAINLIIGKLMTRFYEEEQKQVEDEVPPCIYAIIGSMIPIITNPGHFLHEKACEFLLAGPSIKADHIPLLRAVSKSDSEHSRREIGWLITALKNSLQCEQDIRLFLRRNVFEWAMSLPSGIFEDDQRKLIARAQETPEGSIRLITRNGGLSWAQMNESPEVEGRFLVTEKERFKQWSGISGAFISSN